MNGNPYYTGSPIPDLGKNVVDLMRLKLSQDELGMKERQLNESTRAAQATEDLQRQRLGVERQNAATQAAKLPEHLSNFGFGTAGKMNAFLATNFGIKGTDVQKELFEMASNPGLKNTDAYETVKTKWPDWRRQVLEKGNETLQKAIEKDPKYLETEPGKRQAMYLDALAQDESGDLVDKFFSGTIESKASEEANSKAALQAARMEAGKGRFVTTDKGLFDTITQTILPGTGKLMTPQQATMAYLIEQGDDPLTALKKVEGTKKEGKIVVGGASEPLVQIENDDGTTTWIPRSQAAGKKVGKVGGKDKNKNAILEAMGIKNKDTGGYKIGETRTVKGKQYKYLGKDRWEEL